MLHPLLSAALRLADCNSLLAIRILCQARRVMVQWH